MNYSDNCNSYFNLPQPLPPGQDRLKKFPITGPEGPDFPWGVCPGVLVTGGMVTARLIDPCIGSLSTNSQIDAIVFKCMALDVRNPSTLSIKRNVTWDL